ncbi:DUF2550 domain-containing protein [Zhihengliuella halotolerans]|uniref:DUF2550 domain-containing protein n=1 Tax=Zhihengliuella halotolerans TaxID=370736 RepID=UPI0021558939|nr:DUF2550 domain-containing protein [Zhihengliuella halotolerans]
MSDVGIHLIVVAIMVVVMMCGAFGLRRYQLRSALGTFDASVSHASGRWRAGVCRYADRELEFMSLFSLSPIPRHRYLRSSLRLDGWREPQGHDAKRLPAGWVIACLRHEGDDIELAMNYGAYTGLSSWLEAGPVVGVGTWR